MLCGKLFFSFLEKKKYHTHGEIKKINEKFLTTCADWLPATTEFVFQTDQEFMFNETLEVVENSEFNNIEFFAESAHGIPTHWEKQKILEGARIWRMRFRKK